jgi:hypothetical protein
MDDIQTQFQTLSLVLSHMKEMKMGLLLITAERLHSANLTALLSSRQLKSVTHCTVSSARVIEVIEIYIFLQSYRKLD